MQELLKPLVGLIILESLAYILASALLSEWSMKGV
jgi:hypothetical protein